MPPPSKADKPFTERLKAFFRTSKSSLSRPQDQEIQLSPETIQDLGADQPVQVRLQKLRDLQDIVKEKRLQKHGVELLWVKINDLVSVGDVEVRQTTLMFLSDLLQGQYDSLDLMRAQFFKCIKLHNIKEDLVIRVQLFHSLTDGGKEILHFEEEAGVLCLELLEQSMEVKVACAQVLGLIVNLVKFNSAFLDVEVVIRLIANLSILVCNTKQDSEILSCLEIFECLVMYSFVPSDALVNFVSSLCRVVNLPQVEAAAWSTMRNLMGTHLGHSALYSLCVLIQSQSNTTDAPLIRGAVLFIGTSLWGPNRVASLKYSAMAVLPMLAIALDSGHQRVVCEVAAQIQSLVVRQGCSLSAPGWEEAVTVLECLVKRMELCDQSIKPQIQSHLKATLIELEALAIKSQYLGSQTRLYVLMETLSDICPEESVMHLIKYRCEYLHPAREGWVENLFRLMDRFFLKENRQPIRMRMLEVLRETVLSNILMFEDILLEKCVLPFLSSPEAEVDKIVRVKCVETLSQLAVKASGKHLTELLDILESVLNLKRVCDAGGREGVGGKKDPVTGPVKKDSQGLTAVGSLSDITASSSATEPSTYTREDFFHYQEALLGVKSVFRQKFHSPPVTCVKRCFYILVTVLDQIYDSSPSIVDKTGEMRMEVFRCLLSLRARSDYHLGFRSSCEDGVNCVDFSPYVVCDRRNPDQPVSPATLEKGLVTLSLTRACMGVIRCLKEERDWKVLSLVLSEVPSVLQNKGMLIRYGASISLLAKALCSLVNPGTKMPDKNLPPKFMRSDFNMAVYPVLAALASYSRWIDIELQRVIIECLINGLLTVECSKVCIVALTACILEMSGSMMNKLRELLPVLSKISATVHIAIPVLEFLSTLISLPKLFTSFSHAQYLSVFAITLPYTNPFKFNQYTVSLAHHVIIMWFLKCRLSSRRDFVKFIVKGLDGNMLQSFDKGNFRKSDQQLAAQNQDSSSRGRSMSWKEDKPPARTRHMTGVSSRPQITKPQDTGMNERQALLTFHMELTETCVDIMARYSFANPSAHPVRSCSSQFLLESGQSASWLLGNAIVTVSVSGCGISTNIGGLCDNCSKICNTKSKSSSLATDTTNSLKKRHVSEQSSRNSSKEAEPNPLNISQDDLEIREKSSLLSDLSQEGPTTPRAPTTASSHSSNRLCSCWCQGWCEIFVRRPSGNTSWMCRLQNGQLTSGPDDSDLGDIISLIMAESRSVGDEMQSSGKPRVSRSNSNPEITEKLSETDLSRLHHGTSRQQSCDPIPESIEEENSQSARKDKVRKLIMPTLPSRPRSNTVDSTSPIKSRRPNFGLAAIPPVKPERSTLMAPQFMFLQLYQASGAAGSSGERPMLIPKTMMFENSLKILDRIHCQEVHKIGVVYVGLGQANNEKEILANRYGSARYASFLAGLGSLIDLTEVDASTVFLGGLSHRDRDGDFAIVWQDDAMQVVYHTATLMPNRDCDPQNNKKKRHIGNDFVSIVYNESGEAYKMGTIKAQFIYATVVVEPLDFESNRISILAKPEMTEFLSHLSSEKVVSDDNVSMLVRQIALHCTLAANIYSNIQRKADPYASNWLERLRHIKRLKGKLVKEREEAASRGEGGKGPDEDDLLHDFTGHTVHTN